jgi:hypothetical protein
MAQFGPHPSSSTTAVVSLPRGSICERSHDVPASQQAVVSGTDVTMAQTMRSNGGSCRILI